MPITWHALLVILLASDILREEYSLKQLRSQFDVPLWKIGNRLRRLRLSQTVLLSCRHTYIHPLSVISRIFVLLFYLLIWDLKQSPGTRVIAICNRLHGC